MDLPSVLARGPRPLRAGDVVEVRSAAEILATLGPDATIDGLPLMPEMLQHVGQRFTVASRADTTCFYGSLLDLDSTVHLTGLRCDGSAHGGCQARCQMYWKEEWLRPVEPGDDDAARRPIDLPAPTLRAGCTREDVVRAVHPPPGPDGEELWSCQATQIREATTRIRPWDLRHYVRDVRTGNLRVREVLRWALPSLLLAYQGISRRNWPRWLQVARGADIPFVHGRLTRTPLVSLGLKAGERVWVRSRTEVRDTLDRKGRNRGLSFDVEMAPYCGQEMVVERVVTRIIDERDGRMVEPPGSCIVLDGAVCQGLYHGLCQRQSQPYWREAWLERAEPSAEVRPAVVPEPRAATPRSQV